MLPHLLLAHQEERVEVLRNFHLERRVMRDNSDPFSLVEEQFIDLFRLNKDQTRFLIQNITPHMHNSSRYHAVHPITRIFVALSFYATGTYQRVIGQSFQLSVSQQSTSRCIHEVSNLIIEHLSDQFIKFPQTLDAKNIIKEAFMRHTRFPGVIGAIDCTHIAIIKPVHEEHNYVNRKRYHSKNVQIVSNTKNYTCL